MISDKYSVVLKIILLKSKYHNVIPKGDNLNEKINNDTVFCFC